MKTLTNTTAEVANKIIAKINNNKNNAKVYKIEIREEYMCGCLKEANDGGKYMDILVKYEDTQLKAYFTELSDWDYCDMYSSDFIDTEFKDTCSSVFNISAEKYENITTIRIIRRIFDYCAPSEEYTKERQDAADEYFCVVANNGILAKVDCGPSEQEEKKQSDAEQALLNTGVSKCFVRAIYDLADQYAEEYPGYNDYSLDVKNFFYNIK